MNTPQPKLCKDCKHLAKSSVGDAFSWKCMAAANIQERTVDLVTGETLIKRWFITCYAARAEGVQQRENCGPEGKWFEQAPSRFNEPLAATRISKPDRAADLLSQLDAL